MLNRFLSENILLHSHRIESTRIQKAACRYVTTQIHTHML